ncbi:predicted protein [Sclerotinia sclerotiorum 1980 UF-70]|uniref:Uncharacterized protein n=1 Tax=Sclerotinia sclerotiorum (strain ATCC 18683 / 1980 / Ss-1) TaxID=665079 RepID=A7EMA3_SCLS1|nr:predicted protein [Sclerotinia sclerotiorum 1980 UF-70]EDO03969.1 predicted protein [Sclerotinia sclerotiorum 1980 UF-70]
MTACSLYLGIAFEEYYVGKVESDSRLDNDDYLFIIIGMRTQAYIVQATCNQKDWRIRWNRDYQ